MTKTFSLSEPNYYSQFTHGHPVILPHLLLQFHCYIYRIATGCNYFKFFCFYPKFYLGCWKKQTCWSIAQFTQSSSRIHSATSWYYSAKFNCTTNSQIWNNHIWGQVKFHLYFYQFKQDWIKISDKNFQIESINSFRSYALSRTNKWP